MKKTTLILFALICYTLNANNLLDLNKTEQKKELNNTVITDSYYYKGKLVTLTRVSSLDQTSYENNETNKTRKSITYTDENNQTIKVSNRVIVKFKKTPDIKKIASDYNITVIKKMRKIYIFEVPKITNVLNTAKHIYENEDVKYAQPSFIKTVKNSALIVPESIENHHIKMHTRVIAHDMEDTNSRLDEEGSVNYYKYYDDVFRYADESFWQIHNRGGFEASAYSEGVFTTIQSVEDIDPNILEAIDEDYTGKNIKIAVIDSAFSLQHPDLRFSDTYNIYRKNRDISPDTTGDFHGTAVAGVIAANRNNNYGIMGVSPDAYLIGLNGLFEIEDTAYFSESYIEMFYSALDKGVDIINCSWGTVDILDEAIEDVLLEVAEEGRNGKGAFIVFSTGNEGSLQLGKEAALPFVISVGSIESNGRRSGFSTYGDKLDLVAPTNFVSLDLVGEDGFEEGEKGFVTGTSFSAPIVSGCIALILEANPDLTRAQVMDIIYSTVKKVGEGNFTDGTFTYDYSYALDVDDPYNVKYSKNSHVGYGLIDVYAAIKKANTYRKDQELITLPSLDQVTIDALENGWSIIAALESIKDFSIFDNTEIVWSSIDGVWRGYSPYGHYRDELSTKGILLTEVPQNSALWVYK
ncbi:MAG: S8 family serine peptidase [Epsilonproteobacteria bacterium]|nr:S8 family serine peptidase [Campylobacterota bacterium]